MTVSRGVLLAALVFAFMAVGVVAGQSDNPSVAEAESQTSSVVQTLEQQHQTVPQIITGLLFGVGIGSIFGSVAAYEYWDMKLK